MKGILDSWGVDPFYLFVVMFIIQIVMIVLYVMLNTKYRRLQKSYVTFMRGKNGKNLEKSIFGKFDELDENNNGWIFNAMHSREGCYTYIKEVVNGESYIELSSEEKECLEKAVYQEKYDLRDMEE